MGHAQLGTVLQQIDRLVNARGSEDASDGELLGRFRMQRDEQAFVALLRRHGPLVFHVCRRIQGNEHDAEDTFQATFLLLARKAGSIRKQDSVASWLYGVAHRLALAAKEQGERRRIRERRAADMRKSSAVSDRAWQELQATLEDALQQVPEKYRTPLLLCYLEGKTQEEAARQLGCPLGTVRSRLARGRARLKAVLERQGVHLSAPALATTFAVGGVATAVPPQLLRVTAKAALAYAAGGLPATLVSARAASLLAKGLETWGRAKLQAALAVVLAIGTLGLGAGVLARPDLADPTQVPAMAQEIQGGTTESPIASRKKVEQPGRDVVTLRGTVFAPDGRPVAGAKLLLLGKADHPVDLGTSAAGGQFTVMVPKKRSDQYLVARMDGSGIDFIHLGNPNPADPIGLRLVKDQVVRGRVIDLQGQPVARVRVKATGLVTYPNDSLDSFLATWKNRSLGDGLPDGMKSIEEMAGTLFSTTTDAAGQFALHGIGAERVVTLRLSGAGIADDEVRVATRQGFDPKSYNQAALHSTPRGLEQLGLRRVLHAPEVHIVAETGKTVRGVVREADTGKGRPGVEVWLTRSGDSLGNLLPLLLKTRTDAQGRYEIHGARKGKSYMLEVLSDADAGYMACQVWAADTPGYQPVTADFRVARGVIVTGKIIDKATGEGVPGFAYVDPLSGNRFAKDYPEFNSSAWAAPDGRATADDGSFRLVTIPGPVLLMGAPEGRGFPVPLEAYYKYKPAVPDPSYPQYFTKKDGGYFTVGNGLRNVRGNNFCKVLEIAPGSKTVNQDILLEPATVLPVHIQDAAGRPVAGTLMTGMGPENWHRPIACKTDTCSVYNLEPGKPRLLVFFDPARKLIGTITLKGDEKQPVVVKLGPTGSLKGRLLGEDGNPLAGIVIRLHYQDREAEEIHEVIYKAKQVVTDGTGAFAFDAVIPGLAFELSFRREGRDFEWVKKPAEPKVRVKPGEFRDLGRIRLKPVAGNPGG